MRNSRFVLALAAVACAAALPAVAAAHKGHGHPGKGHNGNATVLRLAPAAGSDGQGHGRALQHAGALSIALRVHGLTPGAFYATDLHSGSCLAQGASALSFPDLYADEHGIATLVTTVRTDPAANFVANGFYVAVHAGNQHGRLISCGDVTVKADKPDKSAAFTWLKGASVTAARSSCRRARRHRLDQPQRPDPGPHAVHLHAGTCACPSTVPVSLGDVTAGPDGKASMKLASTSTIPVVARGTC